MAKHDPFCDVIIWELHVKVRKSLWRKERCKKMKYMKQRHCKTLLVVTEAANTVSLVLVLFSMLP